MRRHAVLHFPLNHGSGNRAPELVSKSELPKHRYPGIQGFLIARMGHALLSPVKG